MRRRAGRRDSPSTPLAPFTRRFGAVFLGPISRLAPGTLPPVRIRTPVHDADIWGIVVAAACLLVGPCSGIHLLTVFGVVLFGLVYALSECASRCLLPASVEFGELQTFRDLAIVVAEGSSAKPDAAADGEAEFAD